VQSVINRLASICQVTSPFAFEQRTFFDPRYGRTRFVQFLPISFSGPPLLIHAVFLKLLIILGLEGALRLAWQLLYPIVTPPKRF
jgi:hypothetical protein